jgi:hypothetical protein
LSNESNRRAHALYKRTHPSNACIYSVSIAHCAPRLRKSYARRVGIERSWRLDSMWALRFAGATKDVGPIWLLRCRVGSTCGGVLLARVALTHSAKMEMECEGCTIMCDGKKSRSIGMALYFILTAARSRCRLQALKSGMRQLRVLAYNKFSMALSNFGWHLLWYRHRYMK